jgi:predicted Ser/Thr protein kinase
MSSSPYTTEGRSLPLPWKLKVNLTQFLGSGSVGSVFCGHLENTTVDDFVCKVALNTRSKTLLAHEARVYLVLSMLQGYSIPPVHGLYFGPRFHVLAMKYVGKALTSFNDLTISQR